MIVPADIHTHRLPAVQGTAIVNSSPDAFVPQAGHYYSVGIHPWLAQEWNSAIHEGTISTQDLEHAFTHPQVVAVGEAGLDKAVQVPMPVQIDLFERQARWADALNKPLVIHLVKAVDELLAAKKRLRPAHAWIIHGFRGKPELAMLYLRHGFYLSFGEHYHSEALRATPLDRLLLETDESSLSIEELYERAAAIRRMSVQQLRTAVLSTVGNLFFLRERL
ncbi:MAG: TatD family hydrolase [Prevotellaceae bacterium]|jgi:TatD DNase family protein|nr:TatD family hydrolase [Prevotellaceae bacterium]